MGLQEFTDAVFGEPPRKSQPVAPTIEQRLDKIEKAIASLEDRIETLIDLLTPRRK